MSKSHSAQNRLKLGSNSAQASANVTQGNPSEQATQTIGANRQKSQESLEHWRQKSQESLEHWRQKSQESIGTSNVNHRSQSTEITGIPGALAAEITGIPGALAAEITGIPGALAAEITGIPGAGMEIPGGEFEINREPGGQNYFPDPGSCREKSRSGDQEGKKGFPRRKKGFSQGKKLMILVKGMIRHWQSKITPNSKPQGVQIRLIRFPTPQANTSYLTRWMKPGASHPRRRVILSTNLSGVSH